VNDGEKIKAYGGGGGRIGAPDGTSCIAAAVRGGAPNIYPSLSYPRHTRWMAGWPLSAGVQYALDEGNQIHNFILCL